MRAVWYERQGPADEVLQVGDLPARSLVRETCAYESGSRGEPGRHQEATRLAGLADALPVRHPAQRRCGDCRRGGTRRRPGRIGQRVWVYGAQSYRPFGTAAEFTVLPSEHAVDLPDEVSDEIGACLGIPGVTAHRAVFADGP